MVSLGWEGRRQKSSGCCSFDYHKDEKVGHWQCDCSKWLIKVNTIHAYKLSLMISFHRTEILCHFIISTLQRQPTASQPVFKTEFTVWNQARFWYLECREKYYCMAGITMHGLGSCRSFMTPRFKAKKSLSATDGKDIQGKDTSNSWN